MKKINHLQNLHTHTTFCDGRDDPESMIVTAIEKGFGALGFSGHAYMYYSEYIEKNKTEGYQDAIYLLKEKYKGIIDVFCGLEFDIYSDVDKSGYEYLIGSVHYLKLGETFVGFDRDAGRVAEIIKEHFGGDGMKYAKAYYETVAQLPEYGKFDIIGHFDLITKHSDNVKFFDETSEEYKRLVLEAADALRGKIPIFEVNSGAVARGYRKTPYPTPDIIKEMRKMGFGVCITSDCHNKDFLDISFEESRELLLSCGYKEKFILTEQGFIPVEL